MLHNSSKEQIFKMCYSYKKIIPKSQIFYFCFILLKYIAPFLITHNIRNFPDNSFLFDQVFKRLILFQDNTNTLNYLHPSYAWISLAILFFILLLFIVFFIIYQYYKSKQSQTDLVMFGIPSTKIHIIPIIKTGELILTYCCMIILLFSQHIVEFLSLGIFGHIVLFINEEYFIPDKLEKLKAFERNLPMNNIVLTCINLITIILLYISTFFFIGLSSSRSIKSKYGNRALPKKEILFWFILLFQFQGIYSISYYFIDEYRHSYRLYLCIAFVMLLALFNVASLQSYNFRSTPSVFLIDFMNLMCMISGVLEIIQYFTSKTPMNKRMALIKTILEVGNALFIVLLIIKRERNKALNHISKRIFINENDTNMTTTSNGNCYGNSSSEHIDNPVYLIEFHQLLAQYIEGNDVLNTLYDLFVIHFGKCDKEICYCKTMQDRLRALKLEEERHEILHILNLVTERDIVRGIYSNERRGKYASESLIVLHIDYLYTIVTNPYLTMYMCQYYLMSNHNKLSNETAYIIYEIYRMNIEDIKAKTNIVVKNLVNDNELKKIKYGNKIKNSLTYKKFLDKIFSLDKIKKLLLICTSEYEKIMCYRKAKRVNKPMMFTCQDFLNSVIKFNKEKELLITVINDYFNQHEMDIGEECYLLNCFFKLFDGNIPYRYIKKIHKVESFLELSNDSYYSQNAYMILSLTMKDEFIIQYATTPLIEELHYTPNEIIGSNIHNNILEGPFVEGHFAQMKMFLTNNCSSKLRKETFLMTKEKNLYPVNICIKPMPSKLNLSLIIAFIPYYSIQALRENCYAYLDKDYQFIYTSTSFEEKFLLNTKILNEANITYLELFGVRNPERIKKINRFDYNTKKDKWYNQFNKFKSIQTSVKSEEQHLYYYDQSLSKTPKVILEDDLTRKNFGSALGKIKLSLEGSGLDTNWLKSIDDLFNKVSQKTINPNLKYSNVKEVLFTLKLELKRISNMSYFISTITEHIDRRTANYTETKEHLTNLYQYQHQYQQPTSLSPIQIVGDKTKILPTSNKHPQYNDISKRNKLNDSGNVQPMNDSNLPLFSPKTKRIHNNNSHNIKSRSNKLISHVQMNHGEKHQLHLSSIRFAIKMLSYLAMFLYISSFIFIIFNIIVNQSSYTTSQDLFYINNNFFLLTADIFFGGIGCLRSCLLVNNIFSGNYDLLQSRIKLRANDMIQHFYQLSFYINNMSGNKEIFRIYDKLYSVDSYSIMQPNLNFKTRNSSFNEEVFQMYYFLSYFNPVTADKCRINELFYDRTYNPDIFDQSLFEASLEERSLHYILSNLISGMGNKLSSLTAETNDILNTFIYQSKFNNLLLTSLILIFGSGLYITLIAALFLINIIFKADLNDLFEYVKGEDEFFDEVILFKDLLSNFSSQRSFVYENKKYQKRLEYTNSLSINDAKCSLTTNNNKTSSINLNKKTTKNLVLHEKENAQNEEEVLSMKRNFNLFAQLNQIKIAGVLCIILTFCILAIEISNLVFTTQKTEQKILDNSITISILSRVPKISELILYASMSFLSNDMFIMTKEHTDYDETLVFNYYNITLDLSKESIYISLGNSFFAFIYYQIFLSRENVKIIHDNENQKNTIPITREYDILFNGNENLCLHMPILYTKYALKPSSLVLAIKESDSLAKECRSVAGGINRSGLALSLDLIVTEFTELYINIFQIPFEERTVNAFFGNNAYSYIDENVQTTLKILHNVISYLVEEDMIASYSFSNLIEMLMLVLSIVFCCILVLFVVFLYLFKFQKYNLMLEGFYSDMIKSITKLYK